jgi:putative transposase
MLEISHDLSIRKQAALLNITRSSLYYRPMIDHDSELANLIQEIYLSSSCRYGYRKITAALRQNYEEIVNHKKVLGLMKAMNIQGLYPKKRINTSLKEGSHKVYPYLLEGLLIYRPNQVWATDITYIRLGNIFMYFIAIMDLYSRYIIGYQLSHSLEADFCITTLKNALSIAIPEIFNTDQGVQFTSHAFIDELEAFDVKISMDHKGRCFDNIFVERLWRTLKQEVVYFYRPETIRDLEKCLDDFVPWYNDHRLHQALHYKTPATLYVTPSKQYSN